MTDSGTLHSVDLRSSSVHRDYPPLSVAPASSEHRDGAGPIAAQAAASAAPTNGNGGAGLPQTHRDGRPLGHGISASQSSFVLSPGARPGSSLGHMHIHRRSGSDMAAAAAAAAIAAGAAPAAPPVVVASTAPYARALPAASPPLPPAQPLAPVASASQLLPSPPSAGEREGPRHASGGERAPAAQPASGSGQAHPRGHHAAAPAATADVGHASMPALTEEQRSAEAEWQRSWHDQWQQQWQPAHSRWPGSGYTQSEYAHTGALRYGMAGPLTSLTPLPGSAAAVSMLPGPRHNGYTASAPVSALNVARGPGAGQHGHAGTSAAAAHGFHDPYTRNGARAASPLLPSRPRVLVSSTSPRRDRHDDYPHHHRHDDDYLHHQYLHDADGGYAEDGHDGVDGYMRHDDARTRAFTRSRPYLEPGDLLYGAAGTADSALYGTTDGVRSWHLHSPVYAADGTSSEADQAALARALATAHAHSAVLTAAYPRALGASAPLPPAPAVHSPPQVQLSPTLRSLAQRGVPPDSSAALLADVRGAVRAREQMARLNAATTGSEPFASPARAASTQQARAVAAAATGAYTPGRRPVSGGGAAGSPLTAGFRATQAAMSTLPHFALPHASRVAALLASPKPGRALASEATSVTAAAFASTLRTSAPQIRPGATGARRRLTPRTMPTHAAMSGPRRFEAAPPPAVPPSVHGPPGAWSPALTHGSPFVWATGTRSTPLPRSAAYDLRH